jgi:hypothetical protein
MAPMVPTVSKSLIPVAWDVPQVFRERLGDQAGRQRVMHHDGHLLLVTHLPPAPDDTGRKARLFWRSPRGDWKSTDLGPGPDALGKHVAEYAQAIERLDLVDTQTKSAEDFFRTLEGLAPLRRAAENLLDVVSEARKLVPDDRPLINHRDRAYDLTRTAELLYAEAKNLLDYDIARRAEQHAVASHRMATSAHRLNVLAALFFPLATIAAIFGMNVEHILEPYDSPLLWLALVGAALLIGIVLALGVTQPARPPGDKTRTKSKYER